MKVLLLDNYDSFTYNLAQYLGELGHAPVVHRNDEISLGEIEAMKPDRIVISPGPGRPEDAGITVDVIRQFGRRVPVLGVCLGPPGDRPRLRRRRRPRAGADAREGVERPARRPRRVRRRLAAVRRRAVSLADRRGSAARRRSRSRARTDDGIIMGLRHREWPVHGVQFHPESVLTGEGTKILRNFLELS